MPAADGVASVLGIKSVSTYIPVLLILALGGGGWKKDWNLLEVADLRVIIDLEGEMA